MKKEPRAKREKVRTNQAVAKPEVNNALTEKYQLAIAEIKAEIQAERDGNYDHRYPMIKPQSILGSFNALFETVVDLHDLSGESNKRNDAKLRDMIKPRSRERMELSWLEYGMRMRSYFDKAIGELGLPSEQELRANKKIS